MQIVMKMFNIGKKEYMACIVTTKKGYCHWFTSAEPYPKNEDEVKEIWKNERSVFKPYYGQAGY